MTERSWKDRVETWKEEGLTNAEIVRKCKEIGETVSESTVRRVLKKEYGPPKKYCPSSIIDREKVAPIFCHIFQAYMDDSQTELDKLAEEIKDQFGETLSPNVVKQIGEAQGLGTETVRYGHSVRLANRAPRLAFCNLHLSAGTMFTHHAFTDESMVQIGRRGRFVFVLKGDTSRRIKPRYKHPPQLMVWGGVSWEGATPLAPR